MQDKRNAQESESPFEVRTLAGPTKAASAVSGTDDVPPSKGKNKRKGWFFLLIPVFAVVLVLVILLVPLLQAYNNSYIDVPIVTRDAPYTIPPMPTADLREITEQEWEELVDDPEDETDPAAETPVPSSESATPDVTGVKVTPTPREKDEQGIFKTDQINKNVQNILIVGTDSRNPASLSGRSDVMLVLSFNKEKGTIKLVSLLRDLYVPIQGHDWNRLNAAYSFGGISLCVNTINSIFNLDIQRFMIINFEGTKKIIDLCGGVDVPLTEKEAYQMKSVNPVPLGNGVYHLDGAAALNYMRIRNITTENGSGDFGRTARQRTVLTALYKQVTEDRSARVYDLIRESFGMIKTNLKLNDLLDLATDLLSLGSDLQIISDRIPQNGMYGYAMAGTKAVTTFNVEKNVKYLHDLLYGD